MGTEQKSLHLSIKDAAKGEVEAVIATLGVVDREGDIIRPDAIANGTKAKVSAYGHSAVYGDTPVGKGVIAIEGNRAVFKGRLFLATTRGRETFDVLKEMGADQEWSLGFRVLGSEVPTEDERKIGAARILTKLDAFEVSPVMVAAGLGTQTLDVKAAEPSTDDATQAELRTIEQAVKQRAAVLDAIDLAPRFAVPKGEPLPKHLETFVAHCWKQLGQPPSELPEIQLLARFDDPRQIGGYFGKAHSVRIRSDLPHNEMRRTLGHELTHAALRGKDHSEADAEQSAEILVGLWNLRPAA